MGRDVAGEPEGGLLRPPRGASANEAAARGAPHHRLIDRRSAGEAFHSHYAASKSGLFGLTKSLAVEAAPDGVLVNCVAPGWVDTDMAAPALKGAGMEAVLATIPLGRLGTPEEIAGAILFLASPFASYVTGEVLNVNGGSVLCG